MYRSLKFLIFAVLAAALSAAALAQEVLPVPEYGAESSPRFNSIAIYGPASNGEISAMSPLMWEDIGVESYKIKFKIVRTGQVITWKPQFMCTPHCMNYAYPTPLFNAARDGDKVKWWVTAKAGGNIFKSAKMTAFVNEVDAPSSLSPSGESTIALHNIEYLMWDASDIVVKYKVVIKNARTGKVVFKRNLNAPGSLCDYTQQSCRYSFGGDNPAVDSIFKANKDYKWFVIATGVSGERAKSPVVHFRTTAVASDK